MSDYLIHYGVKGMKWGVRKERRLERKRTNLKRKIGDAAQKTADHATKYMWTSNFVIDGKRVHTDNKVSEKEYKRALRSQRRGEKYMLKYKQTFGTTVYGGSGFDTDTGAAFVNVKYGEGKAPVYIYKGRVS